jgi:hypothetical protein
MPATSPGSMRSSVGTTSSTAPFPARALTNAKALPIMCMSRREMDDEGFPWSSLNGNSDKYAENGEEMMDILVDDIDRYEQLSNREELSEVCICNKVSVSADRLSTHTNFKKNCHLLLEMYAILILSIMAP